MSFFEPSEPPEPNPDFDDDDFAQPEWSGAPDNVMPGVLPHAFILARTDEVAVTIEAINAYPTGVSFTLSAIRRTRPADPRDFFALFGPRFHHGTLRDDVLRIGVLLADGRKATNLEFAGWDDEPEGPVLWSGGSGGSDTHQEASFWLWPLPPPGPLVFVCEWPEFGIGDTRVEIDATVVRDAAARAEVLWDAPTLRANGGSGRVWQISSAHEASEEGGETET